VDVANRIGVSWIAVALIGVDASSCCGVQWAARVFEALITVRSLPSKLALTNGTGHGGFVGELADCMIQVA